MSEKKWPTWLFSYNFEGSQWSMEVVAPTADEAKRRLDAAAAWGTLDGELIAKVPIAWGGFLVPLVVWVRNFIRQARSVLEASHKGGE